MQITINFNENKFNKKYVIDNVISIDHFNGCLQVVNTDYFSNHYTSIYKDVDLDSYEVKTRWKNENKNNRPGW